MRLEVGNPGRNMSVNPHVSVTNLQLQETKKKGERVRKGIRGFVILRWSSSHPFSLQVLHELEQ